MPDILYITFFNSM